MLQTGVLHDEPLASIATEFDRLQPGLNGAVGAASQQWIGGTINFNVWTNLTRDQYGARLPDALVEGACKCSMRPVTKVFSANDFGVAQESLIGATSQVQHNLSFDVGLQPVPVNARPVNELRAGGLHSICANQQALGGPASTPAAAAAAHGLGRVSCSAQHSQQWQPRPGQLTVRTGDEPPCIGT